MRCGRCLTLTVSVASDDTGDVTPVTAHLPNGHIVTPPTVVGDALFAAAMNCTASRGKLREATR